jgi:O-antigen ligase
LLHAVMDFRSFGGICVFLCFLLSLRALPKSTRKAVMAVGGVTALLLMPWISQKMFSNTGGRSDRSNVERSSMLEAAWEGFLASPVIGNGSWFSNSDVIDNFLLIRAEREQLSGGGLGFDNTSAEGLAIHSQMLVTLAEGGVVGGAFFFCYGVFILWAIWFALGDAAWDWTLPSRLFLLVNSFWDLCMSPFSGPVRINIALTVVLIALFWRERAQMRASRVAHI